MKCTPRATSQREDAELETLIERLANENREGEDD